MDITILLVNKCCSAFLKEANMVSGELLKKGHHVRVKIQRANDHLLNLYHLNKDRIGRSAYIIIQPFDLVMDAQQVKDPVFMANIINQTCFLDNIEKK